MQAKVQLNSGIQAEKLNKATDINVATPTQKKTLPVTVKSVLHITKGLTT
jgi:hypothetical protein